MSHDDVQLPAAQDEPGVDRRRFIIGTAAAGAGMWAAPSILSVDRAFAQTAGTDQPGGGTADCDTSAFAVRVLATGLIKATVGPVSTCTDRGSETLLTVRVPDTTGDVVTADALTAECSQKPCEATATIVDATVDLNPLGIPVVLDATLIKAMASCSDGDTTLDSSIADLTLKIDDETVDVNAATSANGVIVDLGLLGSVTVRIVLNEQVDDTVNAIRITASVAVSDNITQSVDIIVASATATCT